MADEHVNEAANNCEQISREMDLDSYSALVACVAVSRVAESPAIDTSISARPDD